jgi:hypothetical protein
MWGEQNERLLETISEFINPEKITDRQFDTNFWYKKPRIVCLSF